MTDTPEDRVLAVAAETKDAFYAAVDQFVDNETASRDPQRPLSSTGETQGGDTGTARVNGIASRYERDAHLRSHIIDRQWDALAAATLRALARERDATTARAAQVAEVNSSLRAEIGMILRGKDAAIARAEAAERDREALRERLERANDENHRLRTGRPSRAEEAVNEFRKTVDDFTKVADSLRPGLLDQS